MVVGLTGGIGSGKTTIAKLFELLNCAVFYSDNVAKELYFEETIKKSVIKLLGKECYISDKQINKDYISSKIFSDPSLLKQLNNIIHPVVIKKFKDFKIKHAGKIIIKETALLFEANLEFEVDKIILIVANNDLRIQRVINRDNISRDEAIKKLNSQLTQEEKISKSNFIIYNDETEFVIIQTLKIFNQLKNA
jgi:dephospho-CoA kinase